MAGAFPDTSFLFSIYLPRPSSANAARVFSELDEALPVSSLLLFEFENAVRLATWIHRQDKGKGFPVQVAQTALARLDADLDEGVLERVFCDYDQVVARADKISTRHTWRNGHRSIDILHVATARYLRASRFLTFDAKQRKLAEAEGMSGV